MDEGSPAAENARQRGEWPKPVSPADKEQWNAAHDLEKKRLEGIVLAEIEVAKAERIADITNQDLDLATSNELEQKLHETLMAEASSGVTRVTDSAKFVQTIAAALAGLYATALGVTFAIGTNPLPPRGFIAPAFFGLSMVLTAFYLAFLTDTEGPKRPVYTPSARENNWRQTIYFAKYALTIAHKRRNWLRAAVLALVVGVVFMPAPFLDLTNPPTDAAARTAAAVAAIPSPPPGNPDAEVLWYQKVLAAHDAAGRPSEAVVSVPLAGDVSFDLALGIAAVLLLAALWLLSWLFGPRALGADIVPVVTAQEAAAYTDASP